MFATFRKSIFILSIFVSLFILFGVLFTTLDKFHTFLTIALPFSVILGIILLTILFRMKKNRDITRLDIIIFLFILFFVILTIAFSHQVYSGGRDEGILNLMSIYLSRTGTVFYESATYTPVDFMHINSTTSVFARPPGYVVLLASFYHLGGANALFMVNSLLFFLTSSLIYLIVRRIHSKSAATYTLFLIMTNYVIIWFTRRTNNENLLMFLFWFATYLFLEGYFTPNKQYLFLSLLVVAIQPLVRVEGELYFVLFIIIIIITLLKVRTTTKSAHQVTQYFVFSLIALSVLTSIFYSITTHQSLYSDGQLKSGAFQVGSAFMNVYTNFIRTFTYLLEHGTLPGADVTGTIHKELYINDFLLKYPAFIFFKYFSLASFIIILLNAQNIIRKKYFLLLILISPSLLFFVNPAINLSQPWMMRRFFYNIIPAYLILFSIALHDITQPLKKRTRLTIFVSFILLSIISSSPILFFSESDNMQQVTLLNTQLNHADLYVFSGGDVEQFGPTLFYLYNKPTLITYNKNLSTVLKLISPYNTTQVITSYAAPRHFNLSNLYLISNSSFQNGLNLIRTCTFEEPVSSFEVIRQSCEGTPSAKFAPAQINIKIYYLNTPH